MKTIIRNGAAALAVAFLASAFFLEPAFAQSAGGVPCTKDAAARPARAARGPQPEVPSAILDKSSTLYGLPHPYTAEYDWAKLPGGRPWLAASAYGIDRDGKTVWVFMRCDNSCALPKNKNLDLIFHFDQNGKLLKSFGAGMFVMPHGLFVDKNDNIWVADGNGGPIVPCGPRVNGDTVREFSPDGKLLMTLGTPNSVGDGPNQFNGASAVVVSPAGDIFVADGHGKGTNARIVKFDKTGKFIKSWGKPGPADTDFSTPHAITMDKEGLLYVADRSNDTKVPSAVKVFDQNGKLLHVWKQFGEPSGVFVDKNDILYVADPTSTEDKKSGFYNPGFGAGIRYGSVKDGKVLGNIRYPVYNTLEGVAVDDAGNIYGGNTLRPRAVRFMKN